MKKILCLAACLSAGVSQAAVIDFTGGTVYQNNGATAVTDGTTNYDNVSYYEEDGFRLEFLFDGVPQPFASHVGDYYSTGNDVFHAHWADGGFGEVSEIRVSKIDGSLFDLGGFAVSTNTSIGGAATGGEKVWVNTSKQSEVFNIASDDWDLGNGTDPLFNFGGNSLFEGISWFSFTNDMLSSAVGLGLDNFFINEAGDPNGEDPTAVSEPATIALFGLGLAALGFSRRKA
jgi:hypothetical protein